MQPRVLPAKTPGGISKEMIPDRALYIVVDHRLSPGEKIAQAAHAVSLFCIEEPYYARKWLRECEYLIVLETTEQRDLQAVIAGTYANSNLDTLLYEEPDYDNRVTAIAFVPGQATRKYLANLPLAGRKDGAK